MDDPIKVSEKDEIHHEQNQLKSKDNCADSEEKKAAESKQDLKQDPYKKYLDQQSNSLS